MRGHTTGLYDCVIDEAAMARARRGRRKPTGQTVVQVDRALELAKAKRARRRAKRGGRS